MNGSKTIVFSLASILAIAAGQFGFNIPIGELEGLGNTLIAVIGSVGAMWGRFVATKALRGGELE